MSVSNARDWTGAAMAANYRGWTGAARNGCELLLLARCGIGCELPRLVW
jgi:hypothetical protein